MADIFVSSARGERLATAIYWRETRDLAAIGVDPIMYVWGLDHLEPYSATLLYDSWANIFIPINEQYQSCKNSVEQGGSQTMLTTFTVTVPVGASLSYIVICTSGQAWAENIDLTLQIMIHTWDDQLIEPMNIDSFRLLDFALLVQLLQVPAVLNGGQNTPSESAAVGWQACTANPDPYNAGGYSLLPNISVEITL
ncbi:hypothetical protein P7C71_g2076, partial [Lecanoromycetidae sp. Uapishka_2]